MTQYSSSPEEIFFRQFQRFNKSIGIMTLIFAVIGILFLVFVLAGILGWNKGSGLAVDPEKWQAVFSTTGQVYFGHLATAGKDHYMLTDVYYIQQGAQNQSQANIPLPGSAQTNISLVKLGGEIYAPEDVMYIPKDQIFFWENLKDDSQVVKTIEDSRQ